MATVSSPRNYIYLVEPSRDPALFGWQAALAGRESKRANVVYLGGSTVEGYPLTSFDRTPAQSLADALRARFPTAGLGITGGRGRIGVPNQGLTPALPSPFTFSGGVFDPPVYNTVPSKHMGANHTSWTASNAAHKMSFRLKADETSFDIVHVATSAGSPTGGWYRLNNGAVINFSTYSATAQLRVTHINVNEVDTGATAYSDLVTYGGFAASGALVEIGSTGNAPLTLAEIVTYAGDENEGIAVHGVGHASYKCSDYSAAASTVGGWRSSIANLQPDVIVLELGRNDAIANSAAFFAAELTTLITAIRSVGGPIPTCPILLAAPYNTENAVTTVDPWAWYIAEMRGVANNDPFVAFLNLSDRMPDTKALGTFGLYHTDFVHSEPGGKAYAMQAQIIAEALSFA